MSVLTLRELNRVLLARQMLLERESRPILEAVERLVGLQSQVNNPPYIGLWTRLHDFRKDDLTRLMEDGKIVRAALMRSTIHLMTADDYFRFRKAIEPALIKGLNGFHGKRIRGLKDTERIINEARAYFEEKPRTLVDLRAYLSEVEPELAAQEFGPEALAYLARTYLPLVQVPPGGAWGVGGSNDYALADVWLKRSFNPSDDPGELIKRYLAGFGPAAVIDVQAWMGVTKLKDAVEKLRPELVTYRDERGRELFALRDMPIPAADTPAPVRFIPEYDNLILSHDDRSRIIADEYKSKVYLSAGRVRSTFLVDGFVRGAWKVEKAKNAATLVIEPFAALSNEDRNNLEEEGNRLIRFIEDRAENYEVRFEDTQG